MQYHKDNIADNEFDPVRFIRVVAGNRQRQSGNQQKSTGEVFHRPESTLPNRPRFRPP
jgi:hypothetical protein